MVNLSEIRQANAALKTATAPNGLTAVVVGGTAGIGRAFLTSLATATTNPKIYIVGRKPDVLSSIVADLKTLNATGTYIPVETGDLTLVAVAHQTAQKILTGEAGGKIDILFLSPGYITFSSREESSEGLDKALAVRFYSRMRFILDLLPLLEAKNASRPFPARVVTVLAGGSEATIFPDDLGLKEPAHQGVVTTAGIATTYTTMFLEQLAARHTQVSFVHTYPGFVRGTNLFKSEHLGGLTRFLLNWMFMPALGRLMSISASESGERHLFIATDASFTPAGVMRADAAAVGSNGKIGSGAYIVGENAESKAAASERVMKPYREKAVDVLVYEHTLAEYRRILETT
ncbi:hypothetical protein B0H63DRAFT_390099 [Podospora didyma]|uniref:NAD(P)-binding protein n=1 Tax=Podospora didyma TaxID=330526 RepID=A0AAE0U4Y6_9PEZI|nr:hypothetical protein B0H63DRAFT_390099 [Podospora didyma]